MAFATVLFNIRVKYMTKINPDIHNIQKASDKSDIQKTGKKDNRFDKPFSNLLSEQLKPEGSDTSPGREVSSLSEIEQTGPVRFSLAEPTAKTGDFGIESNLALLEEYTSILMDPDRTLKEAYKTLDLLLKSTSDMEEQVLQSGIEDRTLKEIVDRITATVRKEQIKMDRGDYIDQF